MAHFFKRYTAANSDTPWTAELRLGPATVDAVPAVMIGTEAFALEAECDALIEAVKADLALVTVRDIAAPEAAPGGGRH